MIPTCEEAEKMLEELGCSKTVIEHSKMVQNLALKISKRLIKKGLKVDLKLIEVGALLHDIGRAKTHSIFHGFCGGEIARDLNLPKKMVDIIEKHIGAGIPAEEAVKIGLPNKNFTPKTLEEKIICYSDKRVKHSEIISFEKTLEEFKKRLGEDHPAIKRFKNLHDELLRLAGDLSLNNE